MIISTQLYLKQAAFYLVVVNSATLLIGY